MSELRIRQGAPAPLLERLVDREPAAREEAHPFRILDVAGLKESVRRELHWLLNTRQPKRDLQSPPYVRTVIDYGIPDLVSYSLGNDEDQARLRRRIVEAVDTFEPRLRQVRVAIEGARPNLREMVIRIDAVLAVETVTEPVSFAIAVETPGR